MQSSSSLVSILIPVYNREKYIKETVMSALSQTYTNVEVIIVDNASTDKTWLILQELMVTDSRIRLFRNETNIGPVNNWKRCIDEAKGVYGKILWSDDLISDDFVEKTLPFLEGTIDVGFVFTKTEIGVELTSEKMECYAIGSTGVYEQSYYIDGVLFSKNYPVSPGCAIFRLTDLKKNLLVNIPNKIGSDFSKHAIGNDLLIFLLTANRYKSFAFINESLAFFRVHKDSISVRSKKGKLPLHYSLASAYFVEKYRVDLINKLNTKIYMQLKRYSNCRGDGFNNISDFYRSNLDYQVDSKYFIFMLLNKLKEWFT